QAADPAPSNSRTRRFRSPRFGSRPPAVPRGPGLAGTSNSRGHPRGHWHQGLTIISGDAADDHGYRGLELTAVAELAERLRASSWTGTEQPPRWHNAPDPR